MKLLWQVECRAGPDAAISQVPPRAGNAVAELHADRLECERQRLEKRKPQMG